MKYGRKILMKPVEAIEHTFTLCYLLARIGSETGIINLLAIDLLARIGSETGIINL